MGSDDVRYWFALVVKSRCEFKAEEELSTLGVSTYLPSTTLLKKWSDRKKEVIVPIIRGYIFIHANEKERLYSLEQKSVVKCLFDAGRSAVIPDWQIENLKRVLEYKPEITVENGITFGDSVKIIDGPFEGVIGILISTSKGRTLSISIDLIHRSIIVHLPNESIVKALD
ncbi:MAG: UpxY family transcription antiterminator [Ignavibacteriales bacterium]|nr:UpxY family transcription antiterminator [Ignavibacteriales bacterium]